MKDYYYLLGLKRNASDDEIKKAYRKLSKKFHPDVNDGDLYFTERFKDIQEAYEILSDPLRKRNYDNISTNKGAEPKAEPPLPNPEIVSFVASTSRIKIGESITFSWNTINSAAVSIEPFGSVDLSGKITYKINGAKSNILKFTLRVVGKNKTICSRDISVQVYEEPPKEEKQDYSYSSKTKETKTETNNYFKSHFDVDSFLNQRIRDDKSGPEIESFFCWHTGKYGNVVKGDTIIIDWKVFNADTINIDPIGKVASNGRSRIKVVDGMTFPLKIVLTAINTSNGISASKESVFDISESFSTGVHDMVSETEKDDLLYKRTLLGCLVVPVLIFILILLTIL